MRLSLTDYIAILKFYKMDVSNMDKGEIKRKAEAILADKLCRCIKKVEKSKSSKNKSSKSIKSKNKSSKSIKGKRAKGLGAKGLGEARAIAICKNSVLTKKNVYTPKFTCKGTAKLLPSKHKHNTLMTLPS